jgi:ribonuclease P protein subunit RPR2
MVRIARERVDDLFALAEREAASGHPELADRYVGLARRVGMRYNVRLLREYRELYCRGCSSFWIEGRTVRTRLRAGHRVRTCLRCGRQRRTVWKAPRSGSAAAEALGAPAAREAAVFVGPEGDADEGESDDGSEEE